MHVYIFKCNNGTYKIGKSNDIARRKIEVEDTYNIKVEVYAWKVIEDTLKFESMLHKRFQHYKADIIGTKEFFRVSKRQIDELIQEHCFTMAINTIKSEIKRANVIEKIVKDTDDIANIERLESELSKQKDLHIKEIASIELGYQKKIKEYSTQLENVLNVSNKRFEVIKEMTEAIGRAKGKLETIEQNNKNRVYELLSQRDALLSTILIASPIAYANGHSDMSMTEGIISLISLILAIAFMVSFIVKNHRVEKSVISKAVVSGDNNDKMFVLRTAWKMDKANKLLKKPFLLLILIVNYLLAAVFFMVSIGFIAMCFVNLSPYSVVSFLGSAVMVYILFRIYMKIEKVVYKKAGVLSLRQFNEINTEESIKAILML